MIIKVVEHVDRDNGHTLGYEIRYKPFRWWPLWRRIDGVLLLPSMERVHQDVFFLLSIHGMIRKSYEFF